MDGGSEQLAVMLAELLSIRPRPAIELRLIDGRSVVIGPTADVKFDEMAEIVRVRNRALEIVPMRSVASILTE